MYDLEEFRQMYTHFCSHVVYLCKWKMSVSEKVMFCVPRLD